MIDQSGCRNGVKGLGGHLTMASGYYSGSMLPEAQRCIYVQYPTSRRDTFMDILKNIQAGWYVTRGELKGVRTLVYCYLPYWACFDDRNLGR